FVEWSGVTSKSLRPAVKALNAPTTHEIDEQETIRDYLVELSDKFEQEQMARLSKLAELRLRPGMLEAAVGSRTFRKEVERLKAFFQASSSAAPRTQALQVLETQSRPAPDETQSEVSIEDFVSQHGRVLLLGPPGAGKSTTLQHLAGPIGG